ncbi:MAG: metalloregulator ArsR/SmtB family transcription factor [Anaerolineae bacterium]|nr:metalloregulator ArsR/SmtB family transcription factor [Anaerolineae bacterium]NIN95055.1 metalloregulator ArsR/SmtB family transcription factor [Anaerolineae bacterium]NIQ78094.1 metalloregulator ArsR/SmtB family transcription factor [Anaerolineae bacterium]
MEEEGYRLQARVVKALAHPTRLQMLALLREGERCACEFGPLLGLGQANVSQHLAVLRRAHLVDTRRDGVRVMYSLSDERTSEVLDTVAHIARDQFAEAVTALEEVA